MFAVFTVVELSPTREADALKVLQDEQIPQLKRAPGFVKGTWFGNENMGHSLVIYETEAQARQAKETIGDVTGGVMIYSSEVYQVHAEA